MIKNKIWKVMTSSFILTILCIGMSTVAFAASKGSADSSVEEAIEVSGMDSSGNLTFKGKYAGQLSGSVFSSPPGGDYYEVNIVVGNNAPATYYISADAHDAILNSTSGKHSTTEIKDEISNTFNPSNDQFAIKADIGEAQKALSGFVGIASIIIGIIAWAVVCGMSVFTALDICYIAWPVFRNKADSVKESGGIGTKVNKSTGETMLRFITDDAQYAVQQCNIENGKSPWGIYLKKRIVSYIMLAIILFILITGQVDLFINIAMNFVSGIIEMLGGLAS